MTSENQLYSQKSTIDMIDQIIFLVSEWGTDFVALSRILPLNFSHPKVI